MSPEQISIHEVSIKNKRNIEATVRKAAKTSPFGLHWRIKIIHEASVNLIALLKRDTISDGGKAISYLLKRRKISFRENDFFEIRGEKSFDFVHNRFGVGE